MRSATTLLLLLLIPAIGSPRSDAHSREAPLRYRVESWGVPPDTFKSPLRTALGVVGRSPRPGIVATGLNNRGQVTGYFYERDPAGHLGMMDGRAFLWQEGQTRELDAAPGKASHGVAINERGDVLGDWLTAAGWGAVIWETGMARPELLSDTEQAVALNNRAETLIRRVVDHEPSGAPVYRWWLKRRTERVAIEVPDRRRLTTARLNDRGEVAGYTHAPLGRSFSDWLPVNERGFVWRAGRSRWLTAEGAASRPNDLNEQGTVVGWFAPRRGEMHACRWDGKRLTDLGDLGGVSSEAIAINSRGVIVGEVTESPTRVHAFLWIQGRPISLEAVLGEQFKGQLDRVVDLNDRGQILAEGISASGEDQCYLLTPE